MRRLFFVLVLIFTSLAGIAATPVSAGSDDLPDAPQAESGDLDFSVEGVIRGDTFGAPLSFTADEEGREYVLVILRVVNDGDAGSSYVSSSRFGFVSGDETIGSSGETSERGADALTLRSMGDGDGDEDGYQMRPGADQVFVVGWRLSVDLDDLTLDIDYEGADQIDLTPWVELDSDPDDLRPADVAPFRTRDGSYELGVTLGREDDDTQLTATGYQILDGIDLGYDVLAPRGKFVAVSLTLFVPGRESRRFTAGDLNLYSTTTDQFTSYDSSATIFYNDAGNSLIFEDLQPGLSYEGSIIFDAPLEGADYWLVVGDDPDDAVAAIHLDSTSTSGNSTGAASDGDLVTDCSGFATYEEAQAYYAENPEAQIYIDPDVDGLACEVFFGRG